VCKFDFSLTVVVANQSSGFEMSLGWMLVDLEVVRQVDLEGG